MEKKMGQFSAPYIAFWITLSLLIILTIVLVILFFTSSPTECKIISSEKPAQKKKEEKVDQKITIDKNISLIPWNHFGYNHQNTRCVSLNKNQTQTNRNNFQTQWTYTPASDVSSTPAISSDGFVYFPDWAGHVYCLQIQDGTEIWNINVKSWFGDTSFSKTSPILIEEHDLIVFGDQSIARMFALNRKTGELVWNTVVDSHFTGHVTQSGVYYKGMIYIGITSREEFFSSMIENYQCCSFQGAMIGLNALTGQIVWKTSLLDDIEKENDSSGIPVWGSSPVIDEKNQCLYIATGKHYEQQQTENSTSTQKQQIKNSQSIIALELKTGKITWQQPFDEQVALQYIPDLYEITDVEVDYDFWQCPILVSSNRLVVAQNSGIVWGVDLNTRKILWATKAAPHGKRGGLKWGSCADDQNIYVASINSDHLLHEFVTRNNESTRLGSIVALNHETGKIIWEFAHPDTKLPLPEFSAALTLFGPYLFAPSGTGFMYVLDKTTGNLLFELNTHSGALFSGPAISDPYILFGTGYSRLGQSGKKVFCLALV